MTDYSRYTRRLATLIAVAGAVLLFGVGASDGSPDWTARLRAAATQAITARNGYPAGQLDIALHRVRVPKRFNSATEVRATVPDYSDAIGPVTLRAVFSRDGKTLGSMPLPVRVKVFANALVTNHRIGRKQVIGPGDLDTERVEITKLVKWIVTDPNEVVGQWAKRTVNAGQIVESRWLEEVPLIRRGEHVSLTYQAGSVEVSANVIAMEDGYRNQEIRVKHVHTKRLMPAVVIDEDTVEPVQ